MIKLLMSIFSKKPKYKIAIDNDVNDPWWRIYKLEGYQYKRIGFKRKKKDAIDYIQRLAELENTKEEYFDDNGNSVTDEP